MPRLEIIHHGEDKATLISAGWGAEARMKAEDLQDLHIDFDVIHIAALSHPNRQMQFAEICRSQFKGAVLSAGTYARAIGMDKAAVLELIGMCDYFFMNANENSLLFTNSGAESTPETCRFVTDGAAGVTIFPPKTAPIKVSARYLESGPVDPTGAGDSFCGATLAKLGRGRNPSAQALTVAAQTGVQAATQVIQHPGTSFWASRPRL